MNNKGITLFSVVVFLGIIFLLSLGLISYTLSNRITTQRIYHKNLAFNIAEAGINKAVWCLNNSEACEKNYPGETSTFGAGDFTTTLTSIGADYVVVSTGTVNNVTKTIKTKITSTATSAAASFYYGVQVGEGGLTMGNNSFINGNLYSNGNIEGSGAYATGDVLVAGGTQSTADQEQVTYTSDFIFRNTSGNRDIAQSFQAGITDSINYVSLYLKKVGGPDNATVIIAEDDGGQPATTSLASGTLNASQVTSTYGWLDISFSSSVELTSGETYWIVIDDPSYKSNKYFISGLHDNSGYGNGIGVYSSDWNAGSWSSADGDFMFKTWMGGSTSTYINGLEVHGDAYANQILNAEVDGDAYYNQDPADIAGTTVHGTKYPDQESLPPEALPISDGKILEWKEAAEAGGIHSGDYTFNGTSDSIGPLKITGNLTITNNAVVTLSGTVWVEGNINMSNNAVLNLDSGYGINSGVLLNDGKIDISNNCIFNGSGEAESYIMMLTTNNSVNPSSPAINISNNADTVIFYAGNGMININNNATLKEATGYKLNLSNNASVNYVSGLANAKFANGPGGIWAVSSSTWQEIE